MTDYKISHHSYKVEKVDGNDTYYRLEGAVEHSILTDLIFVDRSDPHLNKLYEPDFYLWGNGANYNEVEYWLADMYETENSNVFFGSTTRNDHKGLIVIKFSPVQKSLELDFYDNCLPTKIELKLILEKYM